MIWVIVVFVLALLLLLPFKVETQAVAEGLFVSVKIRVSVLGVFGKSLRMENSKDDPAAFTLWLSRRWAVPLKRHGKKKPMRMTDFLRRHLYHLRLRLEVGVPDRADLTAILVGMVQALALPVLYGINRCPKEVIVSPCYDRGRFFLEGSCIIRFSPVNIILEQILMKEE